MMATVLGCQQIAGSGVVQVIGEVRMDRKPLADARVVFIPLELRDSRGSIKEIAFGSTDDAGRFQLRTTETKGVVHGEYRVLFFRPENSDSAGRFEIDSQASSKKSSNDMLNLLNSLSLESQQLSNLLPPFEHAAEQQTQFGQIDVGNVPVIYNIESELNFLVKPGSGILYPKFELVSHPKD